MKLQPQYETYLEADHCYSVRDYLRNLRCWIEDKNNTEYTTEMNAIWGKLDYPAKMFLFNLCLNSPYEYFPKGAIKEIQRQTDRMNSDAHKAYWKVMFETIGNYRQR